VTKNVTLKGRRLNRITMPIQKLILVGACFCVVLLGYSQSFKQFDLLRGKADSAYRAKNYTLSATCYERAIHLPENQKPEIFGAIYYTMARVYSSNHEKEKALNYLEKSFLTYHAKKNTNPVDASEITSDLDLYFIRDEQRFKNILNKYYTTFDLDFGVAKEISYAMLLKYLSKASGFVRIENKTIYWEKRDTAFVFNEKTKSLELPNFEWIKTYPVEFTNCTFKLHFIWANDYQKFSYQILNFTHCTFDGRLILWGMDFKESPRIQKCKMRDDLVISINIESTSYGGFILDSCKLNKVAIHIRSKTPIILNIRDNKCNDSIFSFSCNDVDKGTFLRNEFPKSDLLIEGTKVRVLKFNKNKIKNLIIENTEINSEFDFQNSELNGKLLLHESYFQNEPVNDIEWKNLDGLRLGYLKTKYVPSIEYMSIGNTIGTPKDLGTSMFNPIPEDRNEHPNEFISGEKTEDVANEQDFRELMGMYSMFLNLYKNKSDIESYNKCFITIKELQSERLNYLYKSHKSFETYFRWKLSQLLKFYVRHGTDPSRAIVISVYIIFWFGVFFFFFPSDWDTTSKKNLIQNFKDFVQKNEKGYVIPFFVLIGGFALSLINALTLSLNAFITLGFGNIPTHGLARYVCVIEGFMGWFLLSIFTVALINQVL
jgi:hypothetical protein